MNSIDQTKQKYDYLDLMKFIAIFFVIIFHLNSVPFDFISDNHLQIYINYYLETLLAVCISIFFFVNGALLINKEFDLTKHTKKTIKTIFLTFAWGVIILIALMLKRNHYLSPYEFFEGLWTLKEAWIDPLWFMQALVVVYIFAPVIISSFKKARNIFYFFFSFVFIFSFLNPFINVCVNTILFLTHKGPLFYDPLNFFTGYNAFRGIFGYGIGYFMLGGLLFSFREKLNTPKNRIIATLAIPISTLMLFLYGVLMSISFNKTYNIAWLSYDSIFTLINLVAIFVLVLQYKHSGLIGSLVKVVGENTLGIFMVHLITISIIKPVYLKFTFSTSIFLSLLVGLLILSISTLVCIISKKIPYLKYLFSL